MNPTPTNPQPSAAALRAALASLAVMSDYAVLLSENEPDAAHKLATIIQRETGLDEVLAVLKSIEWITASEGDNKCPSCEHQFHSESSPYHAPDCRLAKLIARLGHNQKGNQP